MGLVLIKPDCNFDFVGFRKVTLLISALLLLLGIGSLLLKGGPRFGIDFAGGVMVQVKFESSVTAAQISDGVASAKLPGVVVQRLGLDEDNTFLVRVSTLDGNPEALRGIVTGALEASLADVPFEVQRLEMVGPKVGADLRAAAIEALYFAVLLIAIYISGRFEQRWLIAGIMAAALAGGLYLLEQIGLPKPYLVLAAMALTLVLCWKLELNYALGAIVALMHDVAITVGIFSLLDKEFDLTIVAALLTIIGYSLNDTIIVFDRIRENIRARTAPTYAEVVNRSVNQTLARTLLTSGTTLLVVLCLYFLGGGVIHDFALAMLIGVGVGTYSSVFVASPVLLALSPEEIPEEEEEAEKDIRSYV